MYKFIVVVCLIIIVWMLCWGSCEYRALKDEVEYRQDIASTAEPIVIIPTHQYYICDGASPCREVSEQEMLDWLAEASKPREAYLIVDENGNVHELTKEEFDKLGGI